MSTRKYFFLAILLVFSLRGFASRIFIPMDASQANHLKSYGLAYWALGKQVEVDWLLNYKGGSFMMETQPFLEAECRVRGITFDVISEAQAGGIVNEILAPDANQDVMKLEKQPKIAVYSPKSQTALGRCRNASTYLCGDSIRCRI